MFYIYDGYTINKIINCTLVYNYKLIVPYSYRNNNWTILYNNTNFIRLLSTAKNIIQHIITIINSLLLAENMQ